MAVIVRVKPAARLRREFATWASAYRVRTVSSSEFGVPVGLVPAIPERLLAGALIDSRPYVPSDARRVPPGGGTPRRLGRPGRPSRGSRGRTMLRPDSDGGVAVVVEPASTPEPVDVAEEPAFPVPDPDAVVSAPLVTAPTGETGAAGDAAVPEVPSAAPPGTNTSGDELRCEPCEKTFKTAGGLAAHRTRIHGTSGRDD